MAYSISEIYERIILLIRLLRPPKFKCPWTENKVMTQIKLQHVYPYLYAFYFIMLLPTMMEVIGWIRTDTQTVVVRTNMVKERVLSLHLLSQNNKKAQHRCSYHTFQNMGRQSLNMKNYSKTLQAIY